MELSDDPTTKLTIKDVRSLNVNYYFTLISFTLLIYEYCLTFTMEVERFWRSKRVTWAIFFFFLNRYFTLLGHLPVLAEFFWYSTALKKTNVSVCSNANSHYKLTLTISCHILQSYHQYFAIAVQVWVSTSLIMRMYALYDSSRRVLGFFLCLTLTIIAICCWSVFSGNKDTPSVDYLIPIGCSTTLTRSTALRLGAAWGCMLVFDTLVFALTVYKSLVLRRASGMNLLILMLRDGSMYFCVMIISNLANILTFVYGNSFTRGVGTTFTNVISSIMVTRLMLNLRDPKWITGSDPTTTRTLSTVGFAQTRDVATTFIDTRHESVLVEIERM